MTNRHFYTFNIWKSILQLGDYTLVYKLPEGVVKVFDQ